MYYSVDTYDARRLVYTNWMETEDFATASKCWHELIERGKTARVREVKDLTSGVRWIN